jgi:hypothetical protein
MDKKQIIKQGFLHALGTALYISLIALGIYYGSRHFPDGNSAFGPIAFLMLFVVSAAITGLLVVAKPLMWYLDGNKAPAFKLLIWTIGWLAFFTVVSFILVLMTLKK